MIRAVVVLALLAHSAHGEVVSLPKTTATLTLGDDWRAVRAKGVVAAYRTDAGALLAVTRADVPNPDAWRSQTKRTYAEQIARGFKASLSGARRVTHKLVDANGVPAVDLEARRERAMIIVRVLLFRTYALSLSIEVPDGGDVAAARAIAKAYAPPTQAVTE